MSTSTPEPADSNDLQRWLFHFRQTVDKNINTIILAVVAATIAIVAFQVVTRSAAAKKAAQWSEYHACQSADEYKKVAEKFPNTPVEHWARLESARRYIQLGVSQSMTNRAGSDENLNSGKAQLEKLLNDAGTPPEVREHALSQLAVCLEALCDGNTQVVVDAYEKLIKDYPTSQYIPWAKSRVETLKKPATAEFYTWFRKANPAPAERPKPLDINPGEAPNIKLDGEGSAAPAMPDKDAGAPADAKGEASKTEGEKPAEFPAETKPAEEPAKADPAPPATSEKPADSAEKPAEAPATEKPAEPAAEPAKP